VTGPYATAADTYWNAGWRGILPLPANKKKDPPKGYTGAGGIDPSYPDVLTWADGRHGSGNIGLRLPLDVIGIDVDAYDDKVGAETLTAAEKAHGKLPPTWRTTSRDDGVSGIRLYRVPPGMAWEQIGDGIETIQRGHRYAVVWPSLHPEGRTYRWIDPSGVVSTVIPHIDELPSLPQSWIDAYVKGESAEVARNDMPATLAAAWLAGLPGASDAPCQRMSESATSDAVALTHGLGSAHDTACQAVARFVRLAAEGHSGVLRVMSGVHKAFTDNVTNPRRRGSTRTAGEAEAEWRDLIVSAVNLVSANMPPAPSCDCDGKLTALIVSDPTRHDSIATTLTDGTAALAAQPDIAETDETDDDTTRTSWWPRDLDPVLSGEQTEPPPTVLTRSDDQPLWYAGKINGLIGESESGKTWVALLAVAQELQAGNRVLYLDFEDAAPGIVGRLKALGVAGDDLSRCLDYCDPGESLHTAASGDLSELLRDRTYTLIVVDGFNAAMTLLGLDLMSNTDVTKFFQLLLRPLSKTGAAVAYVDHIGKNAADDSKGGIGAQAKRAMTTGCVIKVKVGEPFGRGMTGRLTMAVDKDRAGHVRGSSGAGGRDAGTAVLESNLDTGTVSVVVQAPNLSTALQRHDGKQAMLMERLSDWLEAGPDRTSLRAAREAMGGRGDDVDVALDLMSRKGYVVRERVGQGYAHRLLKPYSVAVEMASETPENPTVSDRVPTVSGTRGPKPSNDRVRVSHPLDGTRDAVSEAGSRTQGETGDRVRESGTRSEKPPELDCNGCGKSFPLKHIERHQGYCANCAWRRA
jgi:hypothetical protein